MSDEVTYNLKKINIVWSFDKDKKIVSIQEDSKLPEDREFIKRYSFKVERHKDPDTYIESLILTFLDNGNYNGAVETTVADIEKALVEFQKYGLFMTDAENRGLIRVIRNSYHDLSIVPIERGEIIKRLDDFLHEIGAFINVDYDKKIELPALCNVPVRNFDETARECGYKEYELTELRRHLREKGYIRTTSSNHLSVLIRPKDKGLKDKPMRVIQFIRDKIADYIPDESQEEEETTRSEDDGE